MNEVIVQIGDIIGAVLQPIYFSLFIFYAKGIENKRLAYITIMIFETVFLRLVLKMYDGINFELIYSVLAFVVLKLLYKKKARIPDFITFILAVLTLGVISVITVMILGVNIYSVMIANTLAMLIIFLLRHKLIKIDAFYNKFWNRHSDKRMLKSVTIRGFSSTLTVLVFIAMHFWLIYVNYIARR